MRIFESSERPSFPIYSSKFLQSSVPEIFNTELLLDKSDVVPAAINKLTNALLINKIQVLYGDTSHHLNSILLQEIKLDISKVTVNRQELMMPGNDGLSDFYFIKGNMTFIYRI